jgi:hypothetical protein
MGQQVNEEGRKGQPRRAGIFMHSSIKAQQKNF